MAILAWRQPGGRAVRYRTAVEASAPIQGECEVADNLTLPCTMHAVIERLKRSEFAVELFGKEFVDGYIASKTLELTRFLDEITPCERRILAAHV